MSSVILGVVWVSVPDGWFKVFREQLIFRAFSHRTVCRVYAEWRQKQKTCTEEQSCERKRFADEREEESDQFEVTGKGTVTQ